MAETGIGERPLEAVAGDTDGQDAFLAVLVAHPDRYIIHRNDGLTQVILSSLNGGTNRSAAMVGSAIAGE